MGLRRCSPHADSVAAFNVEFVPLSTYDELAAVRTVNLTVVRINGRFERLTHLKPPALPGILAPRQLDRQLGSSLLCGRNAQFYLRLWGWFQLWWESRNSQLCFAGYCSRFFDCMFFLRSLGS
jgi:hypothetical protein